ncbi:hypothetical protein C8P63_11728 [Melghirimyces profundicolus]|uniref:Uncharacterized protein n=1 Tax=Melghirimyces profundicolus TaxID=1242148 RepID=A0A2T6BQB0_9BACL|nr:hypothetical protein [Melghirimyces profundicolus]PTX58281.1 hypothetical protein C8P63_11728 [Melghirimyces profundicolus]
MRVFPHCNIINFQGSVREMKAPWLKRLLKEALSDDGPLLAGLLDMEQEAVYVYGQAERITVSEEEDRVEVVTRSDEGEIHRISRPFSHLDRSHEVRFDIDEPSRGVIRYPVYYVTFNAEGNGSKQEATLFLAPIEPVSRPLDCVVEFWNQIRDLGRDTDFQGNGCCVTPGFKEALQSE